MTGILYRTHLFLLLIKVALYLIQVNKSYNRVLFTRNFARQNYYIIVHVIYLFVVHEIQCQRKCVLCSRGESTAKKAPN